MQLMSEDLLRNGDKWKQIVAEMREKVDELHRQGYLIHMTDY